MSEDHAGAVEMLGRPFKGSTSPFSDADASYAPLEWISSASSAHVADGDSSKRVSASHTRVTSRDDSFSYMPLDPISADPVDSSQRVSSETIGSLSSMQGSVERMPSTQAIVSPLSSSLSCGSGIAISLSGGDREEFCLVPIFGTRSRSEQVTDKVVGHSGGSRGRSVEPDDPMKKLALQEAGRDSSVYAIPAFSVLQCGAHAFRTLQVRGGFVRSVPRIDDFWSYSRHGPLGRHACSLLLHYGARQANLLGCLALALCMSLPVHEWLPALWVAILCYMVVGMVASIPVILLWRSQRHVFLDSACINQEDAAIKRAGILSISYYLKQSDNLIILWDATYLSRLWCVFELATYLKTQAEAAGTKAVVVLPSTDGWLTCCVNLGVYLAVGTRLLFLTDGDSNAAELMKQVVVATGGVICGYPTVAQSVRAHLRDIKAAQAQLRDFSLTKAQCYCCSVGHLDPITMQTIDCDRVLIEGCVISWFGQVETFNAFARSELQKHMYMKPHMPLNSLYCSVMPLLAFGAASFTWEQGRGRQLEAFMALLDSVLDGLLLLPVTLKIIYKGENLLVDREDLASYLTSWAIASFSYLVNRCIFVFVPYFLGVPGYLVSWGFFGGYLLLVYSPARTFVGQPLRFLLDWLC